MGFILNFLKNLGFLIVAGIVLYILFPTMVGQVFQMFGVIFGPLAIVILLVAALPKRKRSRY